MGMDSKQSFLKGIKKKMAWLKEGISPTQRNNDECGRPKLGVCTVNGGCLTTNFQIRRESQKGSLVFNKDGINSDVRWAPSLTNI